MTLLFLIMSFNFIVDPFQHYRKAHLYSFDYSLNQKYLNIGLAKNYTFDSVIIGTSMTENFTIDKTKIILDNPIKLSVAGGEIIDFNRILEKAFSSQAEITKVLFGLDVYSFKGKMVSTLPEYLYDDSYFNDYKYLLNIDTLKKSSNQILNQDFIKSDENYNNMFEWQSNYKNHFNLGNLSKSWLNRNDIFDHHQRSWKLEEMKNNFDDFLLTIINERRKTKFYLFFPPYSILTYIDWKEKGILETILGFKKYVYEQTKNFNNVDLYDFQISKEVTHNLEKYKDLTHYSKDINNWIIDMIDKNEYLIIDDKVDYSKIIKNHIRNYKIEF